MRRALTGTVIAMAALAALIVGWFMLPNTLFYQRKRPTKFGRLTNRVAAKVGAHFPAPDWNIALEVPGRRSGRPHQTALVLADVQGGRYAVSMLGEGSEWVRNVTANHGNATIVHRGRRKAVHLERVPVDERAAVLQAYIRRAIGGRPHIPVAVDAPLEEFAAVADDYPVFRVTTVAAAPASAH